MSDEVLEQLMILRGMTKATGALHEAQVLQLKMYPMVMLSNSVSSEFTFDWENRSVEFKVQTKGKRDKDFDKRMDCLDKSVKTLLGDEYLVVVNINGKKKFTGARRLAIPPPPAPKYDQEKFEREIFNRNFERELDKHAEEFNNVDKS